MPSRPVIHNPIPIIKTAFNTLIIHPLLLFPYSVLVFIKLLLLEVFYFAPRQPLSSVFKPVIVRFYGEQAMHYPNNFIVAMKWMSKVEVLIFLFLTYYFIGISVAMINMVNNGEKEKFKKALQAVSGTYVHLWFFAAVCLSILFGFNHFYGKLVERAYQIESSAGYLGGLKTVILKGGSFIELLVATLITFVFAYVMPVVVIEKKKIFSAFGRSFRILGRSFWVTLGVIVLPAFLYVPVLLLKYNQRFFSDVFSPESALVFLVMSILIVAFIDALQYTAITTNYLLEKESDS